MPKLGLGGVGVSARALAALEVSVDRLAALALHAWDIEFPWIRPQGWPRSR